MLCSDMPHDAPIIEPTPRSTLARTMLWAVLFFVVAKGWISYTRYLNQDEFETLHQAWLIHSGAVQFRDFHSNHPPVAFRLLGKLYHLTDDPVLVLRLARTMTWISSLITLALIYRLARQIYGSAAACWSVILYATSATFIEWSTEIRTDFVLIPLWLGAVTLLFDLHFSRSVAPSRESGDANGARQGRAIRLVLVGVLMGTAFWTNQKALFHSLPVGILLLSGYPEPSKRWRTITWCLVGALIPTAYVLCQMVVSGAWGALMEHNFAGAWSLLRAAPYQRFRSFTLWTLVTRDTGLLLLTIVAWMQSYRAVETAERRWVLLSGLWMLFTLLVTPGPFPYYLLSVLPVWVLACGGLLARIAPLGLTSVRQTLANRGWAAGWVACLVGLYLLMPFHRLGRFVVPTQGYQREVIQLAHQLTDQTTRVFDGAGSLLNRPDAYPFHWVLWEGERQKLRDGLLPPLLPTLRAHQCELVIDNYRTRDLPEDDRRLLQQQFVRLWGPLRIPGFDSLSDVPSQGRVMELWYDGVYEANRDDLVIDGKPFQAPGSLTAGLHHVAVRNGTGRVLLRRSDASVPTPLPMDTKPVALFLGAYGYAY